MANWRTYGTGALAILVSAGAVFTGKLWFQRDSRFIRLEDYAEINTARKERKTLWTATGTDVPSSTPEYIGRLVRMEYQGLPQSGNP